MNNRPYLGAVLIVSAEAASASVIERVIRDGHYHASVADSIGEMVEACKDTWFHLVLIDSDAIKDPVDDLIEKIRIVEADVPVTVLGGHAGAPRSDVRYLAKPLTLEHVQEILPQAVAAREEREGGNLLRGTLLACCIALALWALLIWLWR